MLHDSTTSFTRAEAQTLFADVRTASQMRKALGILASKPGPLKLLSHDFNRETAFGASTLAQRLTILPEGDTLTFQPNLEDFAALNRAAIRLYNGNGVPLAAGKTPGAPDFGRPQRPGTTEADGEEPS